MALHAAYSTLQDGKHKEIQFLQGVGGKELCHIRDNEWHQALGINCS